MQGAKEDSLGMPLVGCKLPQLTNYRDSGATLIILDDRVANFEEVSPTNI